MCGRLTLKTASDQLIQFLLPWVGADCRPADYSPRYNIAPSQTLLAITWEGSAKRLAYYRWGLVPAWATELSFGNRMINARHETLLEKRSFAGPIAKQRCLVIADGYFEWRKLSSKLKQAYWITPESDDLMTLAGLWERNHRATGQAIESCTLITTQANSTMNSIHDRMPMPLSNGAAEGWLNPHCSAQQAYDLLQPVDNSFFKAQPVSPHVNNPRNDDPECIALASSTSQLPFFPD